MTEHIKIHAIKFARFRGIGVEPRILSGFRKMNFFIGKNNAGKSTALLALTKFARFQGQSPPQFWEPEISEFDKPLGSNDLPVFGIGVPVDHVKKVLSDRITQDGIFGFAVQRAESNGYLWFAGEVATSKPLKLQYEFAENFFTREYSKGVFRDSALRYFGGSSNDQNNVSRFMEHIESKVKIEIPPVRFIPAFRKPETDVSEFDSDDLSGAGIIKQLADLQNPNELEYYAESEGKFQSINTFLKKITGDRNARLEIPSDRSTIFVSLDGRRLPLSNLGSGIHQTILIAVFCTIFDGEIVCIEEPELHLHPSLQKQLIRYLQKHTRNQYFIASHSPFFIDTEGAALFHTYLNEGETRFSSATLDNQRYTICRDLGIRASDLIQSNFVIWVEGPSERIYVRAWLDLGFPQLKEHLHYSIMFYGGRLLSHLSMKDDEVEEFIKLRSLNRNVAIIMDSDRAKKGQRINATKSRIKKEISQFGGVVWVTQGREIENYLSYEKVQSALKEIHSDIYGRPYHDGPYQHAYYFERKSAAKSTGETLERGANKVRLAHSMVEKGLSLDVLDLRSRISELGEAILVANELDPSANPT